MGLNTEERQAVVYFTGYEVEHTICHGMFTLFVVGTPPVNEILAKAEEYGVKHIYFGTSQSFPNIDINDADTWNKWTKTITACLLNDYWCTLDLDVKQADGSSKNWGFEFGAPFSLKKNGITKASLPVGSEVTIQG